MDDDGGYGAEDEVIEAMLNDSLRNRLCCFGAAVWVGVFKPVQADRSAWFLLVTDRELVVVDSVDREAERSLAPFPLLLEGAGDLGAIERLEPQETANTLPRS